MGVCCPSSVNVHPHITYAINLNIMNMTCLLSAAIFLVDLIDTNLLTLSLGTSMVLVGYHPEGESQCKFCRILTEIGKVSREVWRDEVL